MSKHLRCGYHDKKPYSRDEPAFVKNCPCCQRNKDESYSTRVTEGHVPGTWCKDANACSICCELRHHLRVMRHISGECSPKKCPVCEWGRHEDQLFNIKLHHKSAVVKSHLVRIYGLLYKKPKVYRLY